MHEGWPTVLLVTADLGIGGAQETVRSLAVALPQAGCQVVVATFEPGPLVEEIRAEGVPVHVLPSRQHSIVRPVAWLREMWQRRGDLVRLIERHDVDVVMTAAVLGAWEFLVLTLVGRVQVWWRIGNVAFTLRPEHLPGHRWLYWSKRTVHRWLRRLGARFVTGIVTVSEDTAEAVAEHLGGTRGRITVVANGVDVDRFPPTIDREGYRAALGVGADDHLMTMVATFKHQKGHRVLLEALGSMAPDRDGLYVALVGDGALRDDVEAAIADLGLGDTVHLLGSRRDVPQLLAASDSFVLPSLWEGMSVALLEAMAAGLPVVATAVSGTTQVVRDGIEGWLVPPGKTGPMAAAITDLVSDPQRARIRGRAARQRIEAEFSSLRCAEHLAELFRQHASATPRQVGEAVAGASALTDRRAG